MTDVFRTLIMPAAQAPAARALCAAVSPRGDGMFITALSPNGVLPATHYISSGWVEASFAVLTSDGVALHSAAVRNAPIQEKTLTATVADAVAVVASADITASDPWVAMTRLGLKPIPEPIE